MVTVERVKGFAKTITALKGKKELNWIEYVNADFINWIYNYKDLAIPLPDIMEPENFDMAVIAETITSIGENTSRDYMLLTKEYAEAIDLMQRWLALEDTRLDVAFHQCYGAIQYLLCVIDSIIAIEEGEQEKIYPLPPKLKKMSIYAYMDESDPERYIYMAHVNYLWVTNAIRHICTFNYVINRVAKVTGFTAIKKFETEDTDFYLNLIMEYNTKLERYREMVNKTNNHKDEKLQVLDRTLQTINPKIGKISVDEQIKDYSLFKRRISSLYETERLTK